MKKKKITTRNVSCKDKLYLRLCSWTSDTLYIMTDYIIVRIFYHISYLCFKLENA